MKTFAHTCADRRITFKSAFSSAGGALLRFTGTECGSSSVHLAQSRSGRSAMAVAGDGSSGETNQPLISSSVSDVLSSTSLPRSFTYGSDNELEAGRSPGNSLLGSRMNSRESLLGSRRDSMYGSRYGFGNAYVQVDDLGVYLSSVAVTLLTGIMAIIGIILFTLVVTLAVMLGKCQKKPLSNSCASFSLNAETNNLQGYLLPQECEGFVAGYVGSGQYYSDFAVAVEAARTYLNAMQPNEDGKDLIVLDIDETSLSNMPYYVAHHYGVERWNEETWNDWVNNASAPPLDAMVSLYNDLRAQNWTFAFITGRPESQTNKTAQNLLDAGYSDWGPLILRSAKEETIPAVDFKSKYRKMLEKDGYRIRSCLGDQWSDCSGGHAGERVFKLPNPMYYIY